MPMKMSKIEVWLCTICTEKLSKDKNYGNIQPYGSWNHSQVACASCHTLFNTHDQFAKEVLTNSGSLYGAGTLSGAGKTQPLTHWPETPSLREGLHQNIQTLHDIKVEMERRDAEKKK